MTTKVTKSGRAKEAAAFKIINIPIKTFRNKTQFGFLNPSL